MKDTIISIFTLTLCAFYAITPLLLRQEFAFGEDIGYHINWAKQVSSGIREGIPYPRWLSESNGGYGSPTTIFYSPLFYCLTGLINLFIPSLVVSLKVMTLIGFSLSGMAMYLFLRNFCGQSASVVGGMTYQLLPYHVFDLYWRGTFGETFAFGWIPLVLHFIYKGFTEDTISHWIGLAFSYAALVLTHIASAYIFSFVSAAFALSLYVRGKSFKPMVKFIAASLFGLSLAAIYFIPMVFERKFVHIEWLTEVQWGDFTRNFLFMDENSYSPFHINIEQIVMLEVFLVVISLILIYYRSRRYRNLSNSFQVVFFSFLFAGSLIISTPFSMVVWRHIPGLPTIQFPWRWVTVSVLSTGVLIGMIFDAFSFADIKRDRFIRIFMAVFHALLIGNLYLASLYIITAEPVQKKDMEWILRDGGDVIEYRPIWLTNKKKDFSKEKWIPITFKEGNGNLNVVSWKSQSRLFKVNASVPSKLRVSTFYYPGWTAFINGTEIPIDIEKDSGAMLLSVPPGKNEVLLEFRDTPLRRAAKWISIISLFAALTGLIVPRPRL